MAPAAPPNSAPPSVLSCAAASWSGAQTAKATSIESANFGIMSVLRPFERFAHYTLTSFDIGWPCYATWKQEQFAVQPVVSPEEIRGRAHVGYLYYRSRLSAGGDYCARSRRLPVLCRIAPLQPAGRADIPQRARGRARCQAARERDDAGGITASAGRPAVRAWWPPATAVSSPSPVSASSSGCAGSAASSSHR